MSTTKKYLSYFDLGITPNPVFIKGYHQYRSFYCAIISIVLIAVFILYSLSKFAIMTISFNQDQTNSRVSEVQFEISNLKFNMSVTIYDKQTQQSIKIKKSNMYQNGLQVIFVRYQNNVAYPQELQMNQQSQFILPQQGYMSFYRGPNQNYFYQIQIKQCDPIKIPQCQNIQDKSTIRMVVTYDTLMNQNVLYKETKSIYLQPHSNSYAIQLQNQAQFQRTIFPIHRFDVTIDDSCLPNFISDSYFQGTTWYYDSYEQAVQKIYNTSIFQQYRKLNKNVFQKDQQNPNAEIKIFKSFRFTPSLQVQNYRYFSQKIQYVVPQLFTLLSIMMAAIKGISSHYRRWCIKIEAANALAIKNNKQDPQNKDQFIVQHDLKNYLQFHFSKGKAIERIQNQKEKIQQANERNEDFESKSAEDIQQFEKAFKIKYTIDKMEEVDEKLDYLQMCKQIKNFKMMIGKLCKVIKDNDLKMDKETSQLVQMCVKENQNQSNKTDDDIKLYKQYMDAHHSGQDDKIQKQNNFSSQQEIKESLMSK